MIIATGYGPDCIEWFRKRDAERRRSMFDDGVWLAIDKHRVHPPLVKAVECTVTDEAITPWNDAEHDVMADLATAWAEAQQS